MAPARITSYNVCYTKLLRTFPTILDNALLGFGRTSGSFNYVAVMNALASDANTNILSTPTLVTLDNEEAEIV